MSYTKAFQQLHNLTQVIDMWSTVQYKRVAIYLGRIMMAETATAKQPGAVNLDSPITTAMEWVGELEGHKELMIDHFLNISEYEWKVVRKAMMKYANESKGSEIWLRKRIGWICELDSLRAFHD